MLTSVFLLAGLAAAAPCESLKSLTLPNTSIESVQLVPAGPFTAPGPAGGGGRGAPAGAAAPAGQQPGAQGAGRGQGGAVAGAAGGRGPAPAAGAQTAVVVPEHCRVSAVLTPSTDSRIAMEVWLPSEDWNGKFQAVGNGGWAGVISYAAMASALQEGYATASNDTGHISEATRSLQSIIQRSLLISPTVPCTR